MSETSSFKVGDWIAGKYQIERVLAGGGMGVVVAARHVDLDELRAIKILRREHCADRSYVDRFLREALVLARLKGEHIVRIHDTGRLDDGLPYIVMEHLEGVDLGRMLEARGPLPIGEAVGYALEACHALTTTHARGILHRDLKPSNLFVTTRDDGSPCLKVLDFGLAKLEGLGASKAITARADRIGSPGYMAPEQIIALANADARADVWALGVTLFELLTGQLPFRGKTPVALLNAVQTSPPASLRALRPEVPRGLETVVLRCLEKDLARRIQDVAALHAALAPFAAGAGASPVSGAGGTSSPSPDPHRVQRTVRLPDTRQGARLPSAQAAVDEEEMEEPTALYQPSTAASVQQGGRRVGVAAGALAEVWRGWGRLVAALRTLF